MMKTALTIEQSATLISKGVKYERASEIFIDAGEHGMFSAPKATSMMLECAHDAKIISPIFTLGDLLSLLPTTTGGRYRLEMNHDGDDWRVAYNLWDYYPDVPELDDSEGNSCAPELIDALYETLLWAIDHNHVELGSYDSIRT